MNTETCIFTRGYRHSWKYCIWCSLEIWNKILSYSVKLKYPLFLLNSTDIFQAVVGSTNSLMDGRTWCLYGHSQQVMQCVEGKSGWKMIIRCQSCAKTDENIALKLCFSSEHPHHLFPVLRKMQHLRISWRKPCSWRLFLFFFFFSDCQVLFLHLNGPQIENKVCS